MKKSLLVGATFSALSVAAIAQDTTNFPTHGAIERLDPALDALVDPEAKIEVLCGGFVWTEGPVWVPDESVKSGGYILFSDIPNNAVMKWVEGEGISTYLQPAGFTGPIKYGNEPGSNGLLLDAEGRLVSCEHGDRRISVLTKDGGKRTLADNYQGKRFNSPNDACYHSNGDLYFTDPPYGLPGKQDDPRRELDYCGVFRLSKSGEVTLLTDKMTRPNGIAFSPDEKTLYVAQSDGAAKIWMAYGVQDDGTIDEGRIFFDATKRPGPGAPDGLKADKDGNLFATGPGGVNVFSPDGKLLGVIGINERISNCAWGDDGSTLYMTCDMWLCRIQTKTKGAGW
ncbi:MAG: SMP-30/gluconolactonase/LRE family protein [Verrucomicrobiota bacterium]